MKVTLNGEVREIPEDQHVLGLLEIAGYGGKRIAVEINRQIVPRSAHARHKLRDGDRIEIVHAIGGG